MTIRLLFNEIAGRRQLEAESKAIAEASANIRAEATSGDKFTSRARPAFLYLFYVILAFNFVLLPICQMFGGAGVMNLKPIEFPDILWQTFIIGYSGYVGVRTFEKYKRSR